MKISNGIKEKYNKEVVPEMKKKFGYKSVFAVPRITKVVIGTGIGKVSDEARRKAIEKSFTLIAGQKPKVNQAKKSIAGFKLREGSPVGYSVTLRGQRMHDFLDKLINVAIPRIRDFRGLKLSAIDEANNFSIGFKEHIVFPEAIGEDTRSAFGLSVTVVTSAKTKEECAEFLKLIGFPFSKNQGAKRL
ncbi:50S ribosomal protein L5 [Candidatus Parcubacteria bacterium]|nr:50S ribosomal protein L5 [Candidatus Parcubacteria bacterium]